MENLLLLFLVFILQLSFLRTAISWRKFTLFFYKKVLHQTWKTFNTKFGPQSKERKSSYQIRQILALFLQISCSRNKTVSKVLNLQDLSNKPNFKRSGESWKQENDFRDCLENFPFYIFINSFRCYKHWCFWWNLLYLFWRSSYIKVRQIWALFCKLIALILRLKLWKKS